MRDVENWLTRIVAALCAAGAIGLLWMFGVFVAIPWQQGRMLAISGAELQLIIVPLAVGVAGVTALFAWLMNKVIDWVEAEPTGNRDAVVLGISLAVIALALVYFTHKSYPMDYGTDGKLIVDPLKMMGDSFVGCGGYCGLVLGWFVERRWIRFSLDVDFYAKATRLLSGALMYVVFMKIPLPILQAGLGNLAGGFIGAILTSFYCVALHPMLFTWFENRAANQPASSATK